MHDINHVVKYFFVNFEKNLQFTPCICYYNYEVIVLSIGERIKIRRKELKLTQAELAKLIGKAPRTVQDYEADKVNIPLNVIEKISIALNIQPYDLMYGEDENPFNSILELTNSLQKLPPTVQEKAQMEIKAVIDGLRANNIVYELNKSEKIQDTTISVTIDNLTTTLNINDINELYKEINNYFDYAIKKKIKGKLK